MKSLALITLCVFLTQSCIGQLAPDVILQKNTKTAALLNSVHYTYSCEKKGEASIRASVTQQKADVKDIGFGQCRFYVKGTVEKLKKQRSFVMAYDGKTFSLLINDSLKIIESPTPQNAVREMLIAGIYMLAMPVQLFNDNPFKWLHEKANLSFEQDTVINNQNCYAILSKVKVTLPSGKDSIYDYRSYYNKDNGLMVAYQASTLYETITFDQMNQSITNTNFIIRPELTYVVSFGPTVWNKDLLLAGSILPSFSLKDANNVEHSSESYRGKLLLLDFWGMWCMPCLKAMPQLQALHEKYKNAGLEIVGISTMDEGLSPVKYMQTKGYTYGLLLNGEKITSIMKVNSFPTIYLIGKDGKIIYSEKGVSSDGFAMIESLIQKHLKD